MPDQDIAPPPGCFIRARLPRIPQQRRSRERVERILEAAHDLIRTEGVDSVSVPRLAQDLSWPRATIYKFFPTPESVLYALADRQANRIADTFATSAADDLDDVIEVVAHSYQDPIDAAIAVSGRTAADDPVTAVVAETISRTAARPATTRTASTTAAALAAEVIRGCLVHGLRTQGTITPTHRHAAAAAAGACLAASAATDS
ncbi:TetR/AcrR family transcriptional regulator [Nocardia cyriacigeorgica]|nr:TetR/AcrR family transcriptional regulator [Nocardia cyriacigeorgica]